MADEQDAPQNQNEEEFSSQETTPETQVLVNGNQPPQKPRANPPAGTAAKHTVSWVETPSLRSDPMMNRVNKPTRDLEKVKTDRAYLDALMIKPEANDYQIVVYRSMPALNADGDPVPLGRLSGEFPVMYYDDLVENITSAWGGGAYRAAFVGLDGRRADSMDKCFIINIPTTTYPVKIEKYEKVESKVKTVDVSTVDLDSKRRQKEFDDLVAEERRRQKLFEIESAAKEREFKQEKREIELEQMRRSLNPRNNEKSAELALMEKRLEEERSIRIEAARKADEDRKEAQRRYDEDRKDSQRRADDDRKLMMDGLTRLAEKISEVSNRPLPPDNTMEKIAALIAPLATAFISRPLPPPDNSSKELMMEMHKSTSQIVSAVMQKPSTDPNAPMLSMAIEMVKKDASAQNNMMNNLITTVLSNKKTGNELTPEVMIKLIQMGEERMERFMPLIQGNSEAEADSSGYDPKAGFMGNAGKAIFSALKSLAEASVTNPKILDGLMALIGKRNPTDADLVQAARRMEMQQGSVPPGMAYQPIDQQYLPQGPIAPPHLTQPQSAPPSIRAAQPLPVPSVPQETAEFEGAASGLPSNADPIEPSPEEKAQQYLSDEITESMRTCVEEAAAKANVRTWPQYALDHWNADFLEALSRLPTNQQRGPQIFSRCDRQVYKQLNDFLQVHTMEIPEFWKGLDQLIDMYLKQKTQKLAAAQNAQAATQSVTPADQASPPAAQ